MNSYYQNLLQEIVTLFSQGQTSKAQAKLENELEMPYVPADVYDALQAVKEEHAASSLSAQGLPSAETLSQWCSGTEAQKEKAAVLLQKMNLRQFRPEVQKLLKDPKLVQEFKGELIEALMEQGIQDSYAMDRNGVQIEFIPSAIVPKEKDSVYLKARRLFDDWFYADNPAFAGFCEQLLDQELLEMRPFDFEGSDPEALASSIVQLVFKAMKDEEGLEKFKADHQLPNEPDYPLLIARRG